MAAPAASPSSHPSPLPGGSPPAGGNAPAGPPRRTPRRDPYETAEVAHRRAVRELVDLLRARHTLVPDPDREGKVRVLDRDLRLKRTVTEGLAAEAEAAYRTQIEGARDPAAVPVENGGDGRRVDPFELCRELGLPLSIAEHGSGEVLVTADVAQAILDRNTENRPLTKDGVARFARLMDEGRWRLTTDAIGFDYNGRLINGQHRLHALLQVCVPQPFVVQVGLEPEAFTVLDAGAPRGPSDALHIAGYTHRTARAALIRLVVHAERGHLWAQRRRVEADEVLERAGLMEPRLTECIHEAEGYRRRSKQFVNATASCFLLWAYTGAHAEPIREYLEQVATGLGLAEGQPAATVRGGLIAGLRSDPKMSSDARLALFLRGAEAHLAGLPMPHARVQSARMWPSPSVPGWPLQVIPPRVQKLAKAASTLTKRSHDRARSSPAGPFEEGDRVLLVAGPFAGFSGVVEGLLPQRRLRTLVNVNGHEAPFELDYDAVEHER